jgi:hypothetical protein
MAPVAVLLSEPEHSTSSALSTVRMWDTFTTLGLGRLASPVFKKHITRSFCPGEVRCDQAHDARGNGAPVENIVLDNHAWMPFRG